MKKITDRIRKTLKINKKLFVFLFILAFIGIISGTVLSLMLNESDEKLVTLYLNQYLANIQETDSKNALINSLIGSISFAIIIYLLGVSVIGFLIILVMLFWKMFVVGFSISSIINIYGLKGIIYSFFYIFPHQVINLFLIIILSGMALAFSFKIISNIFKEKKIDFGGMKKYNKTLVIVLIVGCITSLYEAFALPSILSFVINLFK